MADPDEGVTADGLIRTGVHRDRVPSAFEAVLAEAVGLVGTVPGASLLLYGSVATGTTDPTRSDVDLLSVGLSAERTTVLGRRLGEQYADRCRGVDVTPVPEGAFDGAGDEAYGWRVFLRHYCLPLVGPGPDEVVPDLEPGYAADARAARGFNGDLAQHLGRWREDAADDTTSPGGLAVRVARKTLLALTGLVSVHDGTWTTDRAKAAGRWSGVEPAYAAELARLLGWSASARRPTGRRPARDDLDRVLADDGVVGVVAARFTDLVGMWDEPVPRRERQSTPHSAE